jgi:alpha-ketoglutaric semialdehyde dehydrogenase
MNPVLLLIDLQQDFLSRPGLLPEPDALIAANAALLTLARNSAVPVVHVHTLVDPDGGGCMPHWAGLAEIPCRLGTRGATPPPALSPADGEAVLGKRFYSAFDNPELEGHLRGLGVDTLVLGGIYLNACIQATALDAYARGFRVLVVDEAVGSQDALHGELSRQWLSARAARFLSLQALCERMNPGAGAAPVTAETACIEGTWRRASGQAPMRHVSPTEPARVIAEAGEADPETVALAVAAASRYRPDPFQRTQLPGMLDTWRASLETQVDALARAMALEIGKPVSDGREEVRRALAHMTAAIELAREPELAWPGAYVRHHPLGVAALLTPWNNPVAIPLAKVTAALAFGNAVVWKPSPLAMDLARRLMNSYLEAGLPPDALQLLWGTGSTARTLVRDPRVNGVSVTGSVATGRAIAALCAPDGKPLQAELGGNNALIIDAGAPVEALAHDLARAAFSFSGQRCTAIRRFIAIRPVAGRLEAALRSAVTALPLGDPLDPATVIGPLASAARLEAIEACVADALAEGARRVCGGERPAGEGPGFWYRPTLLADAAPDSAIVRQESFGPVAVIQVAEDLEHAINLCNRVPHGLLAGLVGGDDHARRRFAEAAEAGILRFDSGPLRLHPQAPFGGWKASGIGPPEHGVWDRAFYTRPQAIYGADGS